MSRSHRHLPIHGQTRALSEAADKRRWHRALRVRQRTQAAARTPGEDLEPIHPREISSTWSFAKDGKGWWDPERGPSNQREVAEQMAARRFPPGRARKTYVIRLLARWRGK